MNKKISIGLAIALVIMTMAASFAVTMSYSQKIYNKLIPNLSERLDRRYALDKIEALVNAKFYFEPEINNKALNTSIAAGYLNGLGDPYSKFLTPAAYREYKDKLEGKEHGIGIITALKPDTGTIYIVDVTPDSSADKEGIKKGDEIINIEGETVTAGNYDSMILKLQGMSLTTVTLTYRRDTAETTVNVMIGFEAQTVAYEVDGEIGYIRITKFYKNTASQLEKAIAALKKENITCIVFDVRNTSEGTIEYAAKAVDVIVPVGSEGTGAIAIAYKRDGTIYEQYPSSAGEEILPMNVLINAGTSGCGELFAVSLREYKTCKLVGQETHGNNTLQSLESLPDGSAVLLTVAIVKPYSSSYEDGLEPEPEDTVALTEQENTDIDLLQRSQDTQYQKAKTLIEKEVAANKNR